MRFQVLMTTASHSVANTWPCGAAVAPEIRPRVAMPRLPRRGVSYSDLPEVGQLRDQSKLFVGLCDDIWYFIKTTIPIAEVKEAKALLSIKKIDLGIVMH